MCESCPNFFCLIWLAASKSLPYSGLQLMLLCSLTADRSLERAFFTHDCDVVGERLLGYEVEMDMRCLVK